MINNNVFLSGRIASDPLFRKDENGVDKNVFFTIAVDKRRRKNKKGDKAANSDSKKRNEPYFIPCVKYFLSDPQRNFFHSFKKGEPIMISGSISTYHREDKEGKRIYGWNVVIDEIQRHLPNPRGHIAPELDASETLIGEDDILQEEELPF